MKGQLVRGRRTNHVVVEHTVLGTTDGDCSTCGFNTFQIILEPGNLVMCTICNEVWGRDQNLDAMEAPGSPLCDCSVQEGNTPVSPATGLPMAHHCECRAVLMSRFMRRGQTRTVHDRACSPDKLHPSEWRV